MLWSSDVCGDTGDAKEVVRPVRGGGREYERQGDRVLRTGKPGVTVTPGKELPGTPHCQGETGAGGKRAT